MNGWEALPILPSLFSHFLCVSTNIKRCIMIHTDDMNKIKATAVNLIGYVCINARSYNRQYIKFKDIQRFRSIYLQDDSCA